MSMKSSDASRMRDGIEIIRKLETDGTKATDMPLGSKYQVEASFKFGGKKRKASNSGGTGKAGRRNKKKGR